MVTTDEPLSKSIIECVTDLSPYTLCLFLLGLVPGVLSRGRPASSKSFRAFARASASIGPEVVREFWLLACGSG